MCIRRASGDGLLRLASTLLRSLVVAVALVSSAAGAGPAWIVSQRYAFSPDPAAGYFTSIAVDARGNSVVAGIIGNGSSVGIDSAQVTNAGQGVRFVARYDAL